MDARVTQTEAIGHFEFSIREHRGTETMLLVSTGELARGVGADRQDRDIASVEFGPEFFPSP